jgi:hypothetical protein
VKGLETACWDITKKLKIFGLEVEEEISIKKNFVNNDICSPLLFVIL